MDEKDDKKQPDMVLPEVMDISRSEQFYSDLNKILSEKENLILDASKVEKITTPGVQMLLAAAKSLESKGCSFCINDPSESFRNVFSDLGFSSQLKEWNDKNE